jgi:fucose 4-O-acetylase-like acetyltransferase
MAPKKRLTEIDDIRGISIIVMIMIHTNAYFASVPLAYAAIELSQFAVVGFIFCSAYLFFLKKPTQTPGDFLNHLWKRVRRLLIPYYIFLAVYLFFLFLSASKRLNPEYVIHNLTLWGGLDFNWLVGLFIELAVMMPVVSYLYRKRFTAYLLFMAAAFVSSLVFLFHTPLPWYRSIMWLPWSLILGYTLHIDSMWKDKRIFIGVTVLLAVLVIASRQLVLVPAHHSLRMYDNKYPPNVYHLAYSLLGLNIIYLMSKMGFFKRLEKCIHFFSINSYSIFFIHILVIYVLTVFMKIHFTWITFFLAVTGVTVIVQLLINAVSAFLRYRGGRQSGYSPARAN